MTSERLSTCPGIHTFTDILGMNIIRFSNDESFRRKLVGRLETAECPVRTQNKSHWLSAGDFASAVHRQDPNEGKTFAEVDAKKRDDEIISLNRQVQQLSAQVALRVSRRHDLEANLAELDKRDQRIEELTNVLSQAEVDRAAKAKRLSDLESERSNNNDRCADCQRQLTEATNERGGFVDKIIELEGKISMADGTKNFLIHRAETLEGDVARLKAQNADLKYQIGFDIDGPEPIQIQPDEITIESPDHVVLKIFPELTNGRQEFFLQVHNNRLDALVQFTMSVATARDFDSELNEWRQNR